LADGSSIGTTVEDEGMDTKDAALILADTNELQGDWTNTGRLDTILDSILEDSNDLQSNQGAWATVTGHATEAKQDIIDANVDKIPKSDGTVSWNATALAAINAEVDTALDTAISSPTAGSISDYMQRVKYVLCNKFTIDSDGGEAVVHDDANGVENTVAGAFTEASTIKTRLKLL